MGLSVSTISSMPAATSCGSSRNSPAGNRHRRAVHAVADGILGAAGLALLGPRTSGALSVAAVGIDPPVRRLRDLGLVFGDRRDRGGPDLLEFCVCWDGRDGRMTVSLDSVLPRVRRACYSLLWPFVRGGVA